MQDSHKMFTMVIFLNLFTESVPGGCPSWHWEALQFRAGKIQWDNPESAGRTGSHPQQHPAKHEWVRGPPQHQGEAGGWDCRVQKAAGWWRRLKVSIKVKQQKVWMQHTLTETEAFFISGVHLQIWFKAASCKHGAAMIWKADATDLCLCNPITII